MIFRCLYIEDPNPAFLDLDARYHAETLSPERVWSYVGPEFDLDDASVRRSLAAGDECFAILDGDVLAAYGWYSRSTSQFVSETLRFHFDPDWVYMYRGFTHPAYRGQRLHAVAMTLALVRWRARGARGLVSTVERANEASLKSCARMGYREFGTIFEIRLGRLLGIRAPKSRLLQRHIVVRTPGCRPFGFWLEARSSQGPSRGLWRSAAAVLGKPSRLR